MKRDNCEIYSISPIFPWNEITREFFHFQKFFRVIKFNSSFVTQSHEFFREIKCKTSFVNHFQQFSRIFREIKFKSSFITQFHEFFREMLFKASFVTHFHDFPVNSISKQVAGFQIEWQNWFHGKVLIIQLQTAKVSSEIKFTEKIYFQTV